jgi:hypothetical protein
MIWRFFTPLWRFCIKFQCACENLFCSQTWSITHLKKKSSQISGLLKHFGSVAGLNLEHLQHNTKLLQLTVQILFAVYSTPKNLKQFFYVQETNVLSNCFIQFLVFPDDG